MCAEYVVLRIRETGVDSLMRQSNQYALRSRCDHKYSTHGPRFLVSNIFKEIRQTEASNLEWSKQTLDVYVKHVTRTYHTNIRAQKNQLYT